MNYLKKISFILSGIALLITFSAPLIFAAGKIRNDSSYNCQAVILTNENFLPALINAIDDAQNEVLMSVFSFKAGMHKDSYPDKIASHLARAVKRGVKVNILLETTDDKSDELNIQNKRTGDFLRNKGINVFFDSPRKTTHTKLIVIDQKIVLLGSHNFTQSALKYNNEISVLMNSPDLANSARNYILKIIHERF